MVSSCPDSSQNDSPSDQEDHRPSFSMPSISAASSNPQDNDDSDQASSNFSMYNSVSQKLMVIKSKPRYLDIALILLFYS